VQACARRRFDDARPLLRDLVDAYPLDKEVLYLAGEAHWHGSALGGGAEAAGLLRRALDLDPAYLVASVHLMQWLGRFGPADEAVERARRTARIAPGPMAQANLARALAFAGDGPGALAAAREAVAAGGGQHFESQYALAEILAAAGDPAAAEGELRRWTAPASAPGERRVAAEALPVLLAAQGRRQEALAALEDLAAIECGEDCAYHEGLLRVHLSLAGADRASALRALRGWRPRDPDVAATHAWLWAWLGDGAAGAMHARRLAPGSRWERWHAGAEALRLGRAEEAAEILGEVARQDPSVEPLFLLGQAQSAAGRHAEAQRSFDLASRIHPMYAPPWQASLQPWSRYLAAAAAERLGRPDDARARLDRLLSTWREADLDLPLLADARTLRARVDRAR
jgi:tetratricopeptide (TPR) repeat protein